VKDDIVLYLRMVAPYARAHDPSTQNGLTWPLTSGLMEAAAEIERLRKELQEAKHAI